MDTASTIGVGMTTLGMYCERVLRSVARSGVDEALAGADVVCSKIDLVIFANAVGALTAGRETTYAATCRR
jgi:hypothetical protein